MRESRDIAVLSVRIQPRASKNSISLGGDGTVKIRVTAPPVDNAANEALVKFLAEVLSVSKSRIEIVSGHTARDKRVKIDGMSREEALRMLNTRKE